MADLKALTREMLDAICVADSIDETVDKYMAEDFVEHEEVPGMGNTRDTPRQLFKMMHAAFPDFSIEVGDIIQEGNTVAARFTMGGTHAGEFMGVPATGKVVRINVSDFFEFRGEQCVAHWGVMDAAGMMEQMGVAGPPA